MFKTGAMEGASVVARPLATSTTAEPFALRLYKSQQADAALHKMLLSQQMRKSLVEDLQQFQHSGLQLPDVPTTLSQFAERVKPIPLEDIPPSFKHMECPMYGDASFAALRYSDPWHPVATAWLPRKPNQVPPPGPPPRQPRDLYMDPV